MTIMKFIGRFLLALIAGASLQSIRGATYTWTGVGFFDNQDFLWSNPANWSPVGAPQPGEANVTLIFPDNNAPRTTTNDIVGLDVAAIHFQGSNYVIHALPTNNVLGLKGYAGQGWNITSLQGNQVVGDYRNGFGRDCPLEFKTYGTLDVALNQGFVIYSTIKGVGGFTNAGPGHLEFFAPYAGNTYSGTTHFKEGTIWLANGAGLGADGALSVSGPLVIGSTNENGYAHVVLLRSAEIAPNASVKIYGNGRLWLNGWTNTVGSLTMYRGAELLTDDKYDPSDKGLLRLYGNATNFSGPGVYVSKIDGQIDIGSSTRIFHTDTYLNVWANISGNGGITKTGNGELEFNGSANTYAGLTLVKGGMLQVVGGSSPFGGTAAGTTIEAGATLYLHSVDIGAESLTLYGSNGVVTVTSVQNQFNSWLGNITLNGECTFAIGDNGDLTLGGAINGTGSMRKEGEGWMTLGGFGGNNFTGGIVVEDGVMVFNKSASAPALLGPLTIGTGAATDPGVLVQQLNQIPDSVPIKINKTGFLDGAYGANDVLGNIELLGGRLWGHTFTLSGNVTNRAFPGGAAMETAVALNAGTHIFHCDNNSVLYVNGPMQGSGSVTKTGDGILVFTDTNTYSGVTLVQGGQLTLQGQGRPGSSAAGTTIYNRAKLYLNQASVTNETLTLFGTGTFGESVCSDGTNRWAGPIVMAADATFATTNLLILDGPISGGGDLTFARGHYNASGVLELAGNSANSYSGDTKIHGGTLRLNKSSGLAIPGDVVVGLSNFTSSLSLSRSNQISDLSYVTVLLGHSFVLNGNNETIGSIEGAGSINLGLGTLTTGGAGNITTFTGLIHGNGGLTKTGGGTFTLTANNIYTGITTVNGGKLVVQGLQPFSQVSLQNGAMLGGSGRVGNLSPLSGHIAPGTSIGILVCSNFSTLNSANQLNIEINGPTPGAEHDQLKVYGTVWLIGATLQVNMSTMGAISNQYVILDNDGVDAIGGGGFLGLPNGSFLTNNGAAFQITYQGGDGNDVALIQQSLAFVSQITSGQKLANGRFALTGVGAPGLSYRVEATTNLNDPVIWIWIGTTVSDGAGQMQFSDVNAPQHPMRFYRFRYP